MKYEPEHAGALCNWGSALGRLGKHEEAIKKFQEATDKKPNYAKAWYNWGVALRELGKHNEAKEKFAKAAELGFTLHEEK